jgi:hypothetical protein
MTVEVKTTTMTTVPMKKMMKREWMQRIRSQLP